MRTAYNLVSRNVRLVSRARYSATHIRSFHSPFAALGNSPIMAPPEQLSDSYEKQSDHSSEPLQGQRTYVVSEPDASSKHYSVPSGAYPTSSPYINFAPADAPNTNGAQVSSTSSTPLAHEQTIRTVPTHPGGVGESASVMHGSAPGEMGERGGSHGGLDLMDKEGTVAPQVKPTERNPPPDGPMAEVYSKKGLDHAWKERK